MIQSLCAFRCPHLDTWMLRGLEGGLEELGGSEGFDRSGEVVGVLEGLVGLAGLAGLGGSGELGGLEGLGGSGDREDWIDWWD